MRPGTFLAVGLPVAMILTASCSNSPTDTFVENFDIARCNQATGTFTANITNPWFPLVPGSQLVLQGNDGGVQVVLTLTVQNNTVAVAGIPTRALEERETHDGTLVEISQNYFTQAADGSVCYFGEDVDIYQGGNVVSHDGAWHAGSGGAASGVFMPATPQVGLAYRQEVAPGIAEDRVTIAALGENTTVPLGSYQNTVRFAETTPLEPGDVSTKVYANGVGTIVDDAVRLATKSP